MASRGRPRYPDILTPREWEVLYLLREDLSNAQIAERLGITERTAKFHVSEILGKLALASREEAASWSPPEQKLGRFPSLQWSLKWGLLAKIGGATVVAAAAGGVALLTWGVIATDSPSAGDPPTLPDDATLAAMAGLTLPTCAPLNAAADALPADCITGYAVSHNLETEEAYFLVGRIGICGGDPPREPTPPWDCLKLATLWRRDSLARIAPPLGTFWPEPPEAVNGEQCSEPDPADILFSEWRVGDTCYDWTFDYDGKAWHCWAVYLREDDLNGRPSDAGCVGVVSFADNWPDGLPTPPAGVDRVKWWCDNRAISPDFVKAGCSILDTQAGATALADR